MTQATHTISPATGQSREPFATTGQTPRRAPGLFSRPVLRIEGVGKQYDCATWGLRRIGLVLGPGVRGLLGPTGAGKSTLLRILATIARPTAGRVTWDGADIAREPDTLRAVLGYLPQDFGVYPHLTPLEFLSYMAALKGLHGRMAQRRIDDLLELVGLSEARERRLGHFSGGMRRRVGIAQALLNDPQLLIVDEPTAGLDLDERVSFRALLANLGGERIVILSTYIVSDVEATAGAIAVIADGCLLAHDALLAPLAGRVWSWVVPSADLPALRARCRLAAEARRADGIHVRAVADAPPARDARPVPPTLADAYLALIAGQGEADAR